jgi:hypothetical protein
MRYDAEMERALMHIDQIVKSTLRKRATRGSEQERMDPGDIFAALQAIKEWYDTFKEAIPPDVREMATQQLKDAVKHSGTIRAAALEKLRNLLKRFGKTHPTLEKVTAPARRKRTRKWSPGQVAAFRKAQAKRKAAKLARRRRRARSKEEEWLGIPEFAF